MNRALRFGIGLVGFLVALPALAQDPAATPDTEPDVDTTSLKWIWSGSFELRGQNISGDADDDDVTGYFDQYQYRKGKEDFTTEFGLSKLDLDLFQGEDETPLLQWRFWSPTSNVSLGEGFSTSESFLNQRSEANIRPHGILIDLDYRRLRTDELRQFARPSNRGTAIASRFNDDTRPDDRFFIRRTGLGGEARFQLSELLGSESGSVGSILSQVAVRGAYETRGGGRQFNYMFGGSDRDGGGANDRVRWRGYDFDVDQEVRNAGGGLVFNPFGLFTLALDLDHQKFSEDARTVTNLTIEAFEPLIATGGSSALRTLFFVPDTDRTTGSARLHGRLGKRASFYGGMQFSTLKQEGFTPLEHLNQLDDNEVRFWSANFGANLVLAKTLTANGWFKSDERDNDIDRSTPWFSPNNATQFFFFNDRERRTQAGGELVYSANSSILAAVGFRGEWTDRDLEMPNIPAAGQEVILPGAASIFGDSRIYTYYLRGRIRPTAKLHLTGEVGLINGSDTGYLREYEDGTYFKTDGSYMFSTSPTLMLNWYGKLETGENEDHPLRTDPRRSPPGEVFPKDFEKENYSYGATLTAQPTKGLTTFLSFANYHDDEDYELVRSNIRRFVEAVGPNGTRLDFYYDPNGRALGYESDVMSLTAGATFAINETTDLSLSYSLNNVSSRFDASSALVNLLEDVSRIHSNIHGVELRLGHWLRNGMRLTGGYRFDDYDDQTDVVGVGSVRPSDLSGDEHTLFLGITLNSDLFKK